MTFSSLVYCVQHYICNFLLNAISIGGHDIAELLPKLAFYLVFTPNNYDGHTKADKW
jgi:hypothetical protein